jgi:uncharacterized protein (TIGR02271 family)
VILYLAAALAAAHSFEQWSGEMATSLLIGVYDKSHEARAAYDHLISEGFGRDNVDILAEGQSGGTRQDKSFWDKIADFFGGSDDDRAYYEQATSRGRTVVRVTCDEQAMNRARDILARYSPIDIDEGAARRRDRGVSGGQSQERIPIAEEQMNIGKQRVKGGGVRVYSRVHEQPVKQDVELREEHVHVERHPTDKPADEDAFTERTIEAHETREEPIVRKEARVVEEVELHKDVDTHVERVEDTVRRTEVEVEQVGNRESVSGVGSRRDDDHAAYEFGRRLAMDGAGNLEFALIEDEARVRFEQQNLGDWDSHREPVRRGYESVRRAA